MTDLKRHQVSAFLFGCFVIIFLYTGLPFDFTFDMVRDEELAQSMRYSDLFGHIINPLTPGWFFYAKMEELRPIYFIFHKFFFDQFGPNLTPVHITVAVGFGLLLYVFFIVLYRITKSKLITWLLILLYTSFPTNAIMLSGYLALDFQFFLSVVTISAVLLFFNITWQNEWSLKRKVLSVMGWILLTWLAIKWKSSEKILPFVYLAFLILRAGVIKKRIGLKLLSILFLINLSLFALVIPLRQRPEPSNKIEAELQASFQTKDQKMFHMGVPNLIARTFVMPQSEHPLTTVVLDKQPTSFTGNLGFFLGWLFWVNLVLLPFIWVRTRKRVLNKDELNARAHGLILVSLWFFAVIAAFATGAPLGEVRYLNYAYVPAIFLIGFFARANQDAFILSKRSEKIFVIMMILVFGFTIVQNTIFLKKWVLHFGGMQHILASSEKVVFESFYGKKPEGMDIYNKHPELENRATVVDWYDLPANWLDTTKEKIDQEGVVFFYARNENPERLKTLENEGYQVSLLKRYQFHEAKPVIFRIFQTFSQINQTIKKKPAKKREVLIYEVRRKALQRIGSAEKI